MESYQALHIHMLSEFSLSYQGIVLNDQKSRSRKIWTLLEYLITFRNREISQNELIELLWPNDEIENPVNTLKTLMHRVRTLLAQLKFANSKNLITCRRGAYAWNTEYPMILDTEIFENILHKAEQEPEPEGKLTLLLQAISIYKGDFLPKSALESWVVPIHTYFRTEYSRAVHQALALLQNAGKSEEVIGLCRTATAIDPYDESLYCALIRSLILTGQQQQALQDYEQVTNLFYSKFGVTPSQELMSLYKEIVKGNQYLETDLNLIKESLNECSDTVGAFYCEFEFFKDLYRLEARSAIRTGQTVYLCLLTISANGQKPITPKLTAHAMERLRESIHGSLRRGDVFTRYSLSQYLLLLASANYKNGEMVLNRIVSHFYRNNPHSPFIVQHKLQPIDPLH